MLACSSKFFPMEYHNWGCPVLFLEDPLQVGQAGLTKWEPREKTRVYLGKSPFQKGSVTILSNKIAGHVSLQDHVVFDVTISIVEHMRKGTVAVTLKKLVEEHTEIATQENFTIEKEWNLI